MSKSIQPYTYSIAIHLIPQIPWDIDTFKQNIERVFSQDVFVRGDFKASSEYTITKRYGDYRAIVVVHARGKGPRKFDKKKLIAVFKENGFASQNGTCTHCDIYTFAKPGKSLNLKKYIDNHIEKDVASARSREGNNYSS